MTQRDLFKACKGALTFEYNLPHQQSKEEKSYDHTIISIDAEKASDKIQH